PALKGNSPGGRKHFVKPWSCSTRSKCRSVTRWPSSSKRPLVHRLITAYPRLGRVRVAAPGRSARYPARANSLPAVLRRLWRLFDGLAEPRNRGREAVLLVFMAVFIVVYRQAFALAAVLTGVALVFFFRANRAERRGR